MPIDKRLASNPKKCLTGSVLAIRNAQGLLRCARLLVNQGERGAAASLAILASEEAIKSTVLFFAAIPIDEAVLLVPTLRYHKSKHDAIKAMQVVMAPMEFLMECILDWEDQRATDPTQVSERPWTDIIPKFQEWVQEMISNPHSEAALRITWWESADAIKNSGLYVDFIDGEWKFPNDVVSDRLDSALKYAEAVVQRSEQLHTLPFDQIVADFYKVKNEMQQRSLKVSE